MKAFIPLALASSAFLMSPIFAETVEVEGRLYQYAPDKDRFIVARQVQQGSLTLDPQGNPAALAKCPALEAAFAPARTILARCDLTQPETASCKAAKRAIVGVVGSLPEFQNSIAVHADRTPTDVLANAITPKEILSLANHLNTSTEAIIPVEDPSTNTVLDVRYVAASDSISGVIDILAPEVRAFPEKVTYDPLSKKLTVFGLDAICGLMAQNVIEVKSLAEFQVKSRLESQLDRKRIWPLYSALAELDVSASDDLSQGINLGMATAATLENVSVNDQYKVGLAAGTELFENGVLIKASSQDQLLAKLKDKYGAAASLHLVHKLTMAD